MVFNLTDEFGPCRCVRGKDHAYRPRHLDQNDAELDRRVRTLHYPLAVQGRILLMADATIDLLKSHFRQLRLPSMSREFERLARDAAATNQNYFEFLLRLTDSELGTRAAAAVSRRIKDAKFPVLKDFDTYDFSVLPQLSKPKILELARCEWIDHKSNCCLVGSHGTGKTHIAIALGQAACRRGLRVRFFTAAALVTELEKAQKLYTLDRFLGQLERVHLLICDELGYVSLSRGGIELLFRVFADRYERGSLLITTNLPFSEWNQIFQGERMTAALLDRLTHRCHIFEMNGESYRFRESMKSRKNRKSE
jgi:DNA replication protein DnaC